ncbi:MAG: tetratricopeptide repeat protein [Candidatus Heimdallarchaeaceae archaeon]|jgi:tetratricopeptide (TPR) repeat protein
MSDFDTDILLDIKQQILSGESHSALEQVNSILKFKTLTKQTTLTYQILRARALTKSDSYFHAMSVLDDIEDSVFRTGTNNQKLDFYLCKIENLHIFGKTNLGMSMVEEAEELIKQMPEDESNYFLHKKIDLLILKSCMISDIHGYTDKLHEVLELCLQLCDESHYDYGKALTLQRMAGSFSEMGKREEAIECAEEAFNIWKNLDNKAGIAYTTFLRGMLLSSIKPDVALDLINKALKLNTEIDAKLTLSKIHNSLAILLFQKDESEEALKHLEKSINIKREIGDKHGLILLLYNIGQLYIAKMENEKALGYLHEGLALTKELDFERPYYLIQFALNILYVRRGELNRALRFLEEAVQFYEERNMKENVAWTRGKLADILVLKGDLDNALQNYILCQEFYEKENRTVNVCDVLSNIAEIHQLKGDYDLALKYFNKSEELAIKIENYYMLATISYNLVVCYKELNQIEKAESYTENLSQLSNKLNSKPLAVMSNLAEALMLMEKEKSPERKKAKELLEAVITEENIEQKLVSTAILNLCELLIIELRETEDLELLEELKTYVERLHKEGTTELAYPLLVQSIWLQANISLLDLDIDKARRLFKSAQVMAEAKEMHNLARRISNNHDILLGQIDLWDQFTMQLPSVAERLELTHIETVLNEMIKGRGIVFPESRKEKEEPVLISIFSKSGSTLYLEQINPEISSELIEDIWPTIIKEIKDEEKRSGTAERMMFGDYIYVLKRIESLIFCYIFIGKSYEGIKKLEEFSQLVYGTVQVWDELEELSKISLTADFDVKTFDPSITDESSLEYSSNIILNQYVDNIFL